MELSHRDGISSFSIVDSQDESSMASRTFSLQAAVLFNSVALLTGKPDGIPGEIGSAEQSGPLQGVKRTCLATFSRIQYPSHILAMVDNVDMISTSRRSDPGRQRNSHDDRQSDAVTESALNPRGHKAQVEGG